MLPLVFKLLAVAAAAVVVLPFHADASSDATSQLYDELLDSDADNASTINASAGPVSDVT